MTEKREPDPAIEPVAADPSPLRQPDELPVVARMVVEIRSDGSRTIARGAIEDRLQDQQVAVEAAADSPLELSRALAKLLFTGLSTGLGTGLVRGARRDGGGDRGVVDVGGVGARGPVGRLREALGRRLETTLARALDPERRDPGRGPDRGQDSDGA